MFLQDAEKVRQRRSRIVQILKVEEESLRGRKHWRGFSVRQDQLRGRTAHTKCGTYLLASSLAAALPAERRVLARRGWAGEMSGLFEHPVWRSIAIVIANVLKNETSAYLGSFQQTPSPS